MAKCQVCHCEDEPISAWQPLGPDRVGILTALGNHYRGFPVLKICRSCVEDVRNYAPIEFTHKGQRYISRYGVALRVPDYVCDALAWSEEWPIKDLK